MTTHHVADRDRRDFLRLAGSGLAFVALAPGMAAAHTPAGTPLKIGMIGAKAARAVRSASRPATR